MPSITARSMSSRRVARLSPTNAPRALGFHHGVRSPNMYGRNKTPLDPAGTPATASSINW